MQILASAHTYTAAPLQTHTHTLTHTHTKKEERLILINYCMYPKHRYNLFQLSTDPYLPMQYYQRIQDGWGRGLPPHLSSYTPQV